MKCQHCDEWTVSPSTWEHMHDAGCCDHCGKNPEEVDKVMLLYDLIENLQSKVECLQDRLDYDHS